MDCHLETSAKRQVGGSTLQAQALMFFGEGKPCRRYEKVTFIYLTYLLLAMLAMSATVGYSHIKTFGESDNVMLISSRSRLCTWQFSWKMQRRLWNHWNHHMEPYHEISNHTKYSSDIWWWWLILMMMMIALAWSFSFVYAPTLTNCLTFVIGLQEG